MAYNNELFKTQLQTFKNHLIQSENNRIVFSGIYGIGKTSFLNYFFSNQPKDENVPNYEVIRLFPVNYSVAKNEDIVDYIRYDILFELLSKKVSLDGFDLGMSQKLYLHLRKNWDKIAGRLIAALPSVGKSYDPNLAIIDHLASFLTNEKRFLDAEYDKMKGEQDENTILDKFLSAVEEKPGSLHDYGIITKIIEKKVKELSSPENEKQKEVILLIDDLDRIDPDHIFRILNVFAAHLDKFGMTEINKFGFHKVIVVCDIDNIRKMFHHRYGSDVDFNGYVDKFYSKEVYHFDPTETIIEYLTQLARGYDLAGHPHKGDLGRGDQFFHVIIIALLNKNLINLRSLFKFYESLHVLGPISNTAIAKDLDPFMYPILWQLLFIKQIIGDKYSFLFAMKKIVIDDFFLRIDISPEKIFKDLVMLASINSHNFKKPVKNQTFVIPGTNDSFEFTTKYAGHSCLIIESLNWKNLTANNEEGLYSEHLISIFRLAVDSLLDAKIIN